MNLNDVITDLESWQHDEKDTREDVRESFHFCDDKDGQWEQNIWRKRKDRPRYTFDKVNHIVDLICGPIEESTFGIKTSPANLNGSDDFCNELNGILRGIEKGSGAQDIYNRSIRKVVKGGFDAWLVKTQYIPGTFNQEFKIKHISNAVDRVWISPDSVEPDSSDAKAAVMLTFIPWGKYQERYPKAKEKSYQDVTTSISSDREWNRYWYKPEGVNVGTYFYCEKESVTLCLLSDGSVIEKGDNYAEMLELNGLEIVKERKEYREKWFSRDFSQREWLGEPQELAFDSNPIITLYGNYDVSENKRIYRGVVLKLMDAQRVLNYAKSKEVEEGALQPVRKWWMSKKQAVSKDVRAKLATMNTNSDPVQFYDHVEGMPPPYQGGTNEVNPHLNTLAATMAADIEAVAGKWAAQQGKNPLNQSGVALQIQKDVGELTDTKWGLVLERAIKRAYDIIIKAMPVVMDTHTSIISVDETGNVRMAEINKPQMSADGMSIEIFNEITSDYNVDVTIGPAYGSAQKEANAALLELAAVKPEVLQRNGDIFMSNITAPGMALAVERERQALLEAGVIPVSQMTEQEQEEMQQKMMAQQAQQDPAQQLAQAEIMKGQAELARAQLEQEKVLTDRINAETKRIEALAKAQEAGVKVENIQADTLKKYSEVEKNRVSTSGAQIDNITKVVNPRIQ